MVSSRTYSGGKTIRETMMDLADLFEIWGVEKGEWSAGPLVVGIGYEVKFWLPYDTKPHIVQCNSQRTLDADLRVCYHHVEGLQRDSLRGLLASYGDSQYLSLPADTGRPSVGGNSAGSNPAQSKIRERRSSFKNLREACELLGVRETADREIVDAVYRTLARKRHPDTGGSAEQMERLNQARDLMYSRRGWSLSGVQETGEEPR